MGATSRYKSGGPSIGRLLDLNFASKGDKVAIFDINEKMGQKIANSVNDLL